MPTVGFLHTSSIHVTTFNSLVTELAPEWRTVHLVDEPLLDGARVDGIDSVTPLVEQSLRGLVDRQVDLIVCTCSTIGGLAETLSGVVDVPVVRVDRPMAELAVGAGPRLSVVAALESTLAPTSDLLAEVAAVREVPITIDAMVIDGAWDHFEAGDVAGYHSMIAAQLPAAAERADVVVLAQVSMAGAVDLAGGVRAPVLASPRVAIERLLVD